ncbi:amino acid ABC transporter permease [Pseudorhodoferax sp. LjRoot39]|uniref:amino acid ABC transporter permease n=1 Tax=Pseudorhodoferax sp. LjRoot39 TaxID=3342328 RepID=UPI003ECE68CC
MLSNILDILRDYWLLLLVGQFPDGPLGGLALTLVLSVLGLVLAFPLGVAIALARLSPWRALRLPATVLVYVVRGVPLLMFIFWAYFLVPFVTGYSLSGFATMLCTLVVYQSAYIGEIVRAGINGLPSGQTEAARALGMRYTTTMVRVVLPQALYNMVPAMVSQFGAIVKETSLGYVISAQELTFAGYQINSMLLTQPLEVFAILAAMYFIVCFILSQCALRLERRITRRRAGHTAPAPTVAATVAAPLTLSKDSM